ncbi:MAG: histidine kinase [Thermoleophilia bacterium]|nr:histidine kinase [Thermoleophilia bacterium]
MSAPSPRTAATAAALFVAYVATTWIGLSLPVANGVVSPVWAPAGIALAGLLCAGIRIWPIVFAAAAVGNFMAGSSIALSLGIAMGNTAEALIAAYLLHRIGFSTSLARIRDVAVLVPITAISCAVSATGGVTQLWAYDYVPSMGYANRWLLWWSGDVMGILVVAPFLFAMITLARRETRLRPARVVEFVLVQAMLSAIAAVVLTYDQLRFPALLIPVWAWSTVRFRAVGSATSTLLVALLGIAFTVHGSFAFEGMNGTQTVQIIQALVAIVGLSTLMIGASLSESEALRAKVEDSLRTEREAARNLRAVDDMKDRLLAAVSHELRTPLTSILALSVLLRQRHEEVPTAKLEEMLDRLVSESRRLDTLLTDLLDLERVRLGMLQPRYERVDVSGVVRTALDRFSASDRPTRLHLEPVEIDADIAKLDRIVDNLLGNAFKHTPIDKCVTISVSRVDDGALVTIDDEGPGVPDEHKRAVFEPFNRGASDLSEVPGAGIGLSLVAHFTELHGGRAWVEDCDGGGSSFRVFLPSARPG